VLRLLLNKKPASRVHAFDPEYTEAELTNGSPVTRT
jgi:hypothetical protein